MKKSFLDWVSNPLSSAVKMIGLFSNYQRLKVSYLMRQRILTNARIPQSLLCPKEVQKFWLAEKKDSYSKKTS